MTLIETYSDESEQDFRAAVDAILVQVPIPPRSGWWHPYELRGFYEWRGIRFRHFFCLAGSVEMWVWKSAEAGGQRRVIRLPSESLILFVQPTMIGRGVEVQVEASEVTAVQPVV